MSFDQHHFSSHASGLWNNFESWDVHPWCEELNLRGEELQEIIHHVGNNLEAVRDYVALRNLNRESLF